MMILFAVAASSSFHIGSVSIFIFKYNIYIRKRKNILSVRSTSSNPLFARRILSCVSNQVGFNSVPFVSLCFVSRSDTCV